MQLGKLERRRPLRSLAWMLAYAGYFVFVSEIILRIAFQFPVIRYMSGGDSPHYHRLLDEYAERNKDKLKRDIPAKTHHETRGWAPSPKLKSIRNGRKFTTNSRGLRRRREYAYERIPGQARILTLGDSFTWGSETSDRETYPYVLETGLENAEVVNLGVSGYGHDQMLIYFREEGVRYAPDLVILGFVNSNMDRNMWRYFLAAKPWFEIDGESLELHGSPVPSPKEIVGQAPFVPKLYWLSQLLQHRIAARTGTYRAQREERTSMILAELLASIRASGAEALFVYLPHGADLAHANPSPAEKFLIAWCESNGLDHCISARAKFISGAEEGIVFKQRGHFEGPGHRAVADTIREYLSSHATLLHPGPRDAHQSAPALQLEAVSVSNP